MSEELIFQPAKRLALRLTIAIAGPTGSGKTLGALRLAKGLADGDWSRVFVVNSEPVANATSYAGDRTWEIGRFMFLQLDPPHSPQRFGKAIRAAAEAGATAIIVDSLTLAYAGRGGLLEQHDKLAGNSYTNWGKVNPLWHGLFDYITYECPAHVICTLRSKMKHELEEYIDSDGTKKTRVNRLGVEPIIRPGAEYDFQLVLDLDRSTHLAQVVTMRGSMLSDRQVELTEELGAGLALWADSGEADLSLVRDRLAQDEEIDSEVFWQAIFELADEHGWEYDVVRGRAMKILDENGGSRVDALDTIRRKTSQNWN
ncbi:MAG TPA: AAA family ATPase [Anaerolineales bacterium]|nr:AAA family ATPase [Anaerolineales bacterium]